MHNAKKPKGLRTDARVSSPVEEFGIPAQFMPRPQESLDLAARLKSSRKKCELSFRQVSEATGVAVSSLQDWEGGRSAPNLLKAAQLAHLYGVTLDYLAGMPEPKPTDVIRPGVIVLDTATVDGILGTKDPDVIAEYCNWPGGGVNLFDIAWRVPEDGRIVSYQEVAALVAKVQRHISEHAPKMVKKWTRLMGLG